MQPNIKIANRYILLDKLGQGGMGIVYTAEDRLNSDIVALKQVLLNPNEMQFASRPATDDVQKLRLALAKEFSVLAGLRHPHIISVLDYGFDDTLRPYYTMTLLKDTQDIKTYAENLTQDQKVDLLVQVLQALNYLHRRGILHRDLKPENVLVTNAGQVKVMDFGLAKVEEQTSDANNEDKVVGTIRYIAPEIFETEISSVASDLYAFGIVAYEVLTGRYPFEGTSVFKIIMQIMTEPIDCSMLPLDLANWLEGLLSKDPTARPATAYDVMIGLYKATQREMPSQRKEVRESFLQASAFVGRKTELKQLSDALETLETTNAFFLIGGESGVGKSRLLDELRIQALVKGITVMRGQGVEGGGLPFQLWRNILSRLLLLVEIDNFQAGVLKDLVPDVSNLLGRAIPDAPELTGKAYQERIVLMIVDILREVKQPLVLILEDLQWVSQSLEPLKQILLVQEQLPTLMIVGNYRNDETPMLRVDLADMTYIHLGRLDKVDIKKLATSILGERGAHSDVIQALQRHSEGNAFFVTETVRAIAEEQGSLEKVTAAELSKVVFTSSMEELMKRRLIKVDVKYAEIQTLAAIIGREVDIQLLTHTHDEAHVGAWLRDAAEHSVLNIQENTWRFAHDKLRETLIVNIPNDILPQIHRTAAETIEAIYPDEAEYNEALLAHWQAAKDLDKAYQYLLPVVEYMMKIGKYTAVQNLLHRMLDQLQDNDKRCIPLWNWLARSTEQQGNVVESQKSAQRAFQLATEVNDSAGLAMSLYNLGVIAFIEGKYESAFELHQQGLAIRKEIQDQKGITESLNHMAIVVADQGDFDSALDLFEQSLVIQQKRGDKRGIATSLNNIGTVSRLQGNITRARALHQQSLAIKQELGDKRGIVSNLNNLANIQEDDDLAKELYQQSLAINQNLGDKRGIFHGFLGLAKIAFKQSDEQAPSWYVQALHTAYSIQAIPQTLSAILGLSGVLLQRGQAKRATQLIGLVQYHPAQNHSTRDEVNELMPLLEATISPDSLQAALERGKELNLDTVVQELLDEFGEDTEIIDKNL